MNFNSSGVGPRTSSAPSRKLSKRPPGTPGLDTTRHLSPYSTYNYENAQFDMSQSHEYPMNQHFTSISHGNYTDEFSEGKNLDYGVSRSSSTIPGMVVSSQLLNDPLVANVALTYGSKIMDSGKELVDKEIEKYLPVSRLKYYFSVDTPYVLRKLKLLFFPFNHADWSVKYEQNEPVQPRYELNAPDLYIPTMAYVTYVLIAGMALGTQNRFAPEVLGVLASSALAWTVVEIILALITLYLTNIKTKLKTFDLIAYAGYKYVGIIVAVLLSLILNKPGYYIGLIYCGFSLAFFLIRSLKWQVLSQVEVMSTQDTYNAYPQSTSSETSGNKRRLYFLLCMACLQPILMWLLSAHLVASKVAEDSSNIDIKNY